MRYKNKATNNGTWGGKRTGAGRPIGASNKRPKKIKMTFLLKPAVAEFLRNNRLDDSQSAIIESALCQVFDIDREKS